MNRWKNLFLIIAYERRGQRNLSKRVNRFRRVSDFNVSNSFVRHRLNEKNRSYQKNQRFRRRSDNIGKFISVMYNHNYMLWEVLSDVHFVFLKIYRFIVSTFEIPFFNWFV